MILRARVVLPVSRPPIADGAVVVENDRLGAVGRWREIRAAVGGTPIDLGDVALLPGLVNAHCHLDYTDMAGQLVPPRSFSDWIKCITELKSGWSDADFAQSWRNGARMLVDTGTTTVGDIEAVPNLLPDLWDATPLWITSFIELTGIRSRRDPRTILAEALAKIATLAHPRQRAALSPHAPYSTTPELLRLCAATARERRWPLTTHVAESREEFDMFTARRGPMFDWLERNERDMSDCGVGSPVEHLAQNGLLGENLLAIHANYLRAGDADLLARHRAHVVHCPRSHAYFGHDPFPFAELTRRRVNVCLGTDSLATVLKARRETVRLNLFAEMQAFAAAHPDTVPRTILRMVTVNGARALGLPGQAGELRAGARADLIAIPFVGASKQVCEAVVHHSGDVLASMIDGRWFRGGAVGG